MNITNLNDLTLNILSLISHNLSLHNITKNVFYQIGLVEHTDDLIDVATKANVDAVLVCSPRAADQNTVASLNLANIIWVPEIKPYECTFLKIDAHTNNTQSNAELKILAAFREVIQQHVPFLLIRSESESESLRITEYLKTFGYRSHYFLLAVEGEAESRVYNLAYWGRLIDPDPWGDSDMTGHPKSLVTELVITHQSH